VRKDVQKTCYPIYVKVFNDDHLIHRSLLMIFHQYHRRRIWRSKKKNQVNQYSLHVPHRWDHIRAARAQMPLKSAMKKSSSMKPTLIREVPFMVKSS
jgi:hypothetical protein